MNIFSCSGCGVVLDADRLPFADDFYTEDGAVDPSLGKWDGERFVAAVNCPVCGEFISAKGI